MHHAAIPTARAKFWIRLLKEKTRGYLAFLT